MKNALAHLTEEEIDRVIERYYNGAKISILLQEYNIKTSSGSLYKHFPPKKLEEICPYCEIPLRQKQESKSAVSYSWTQENPYCEKCSHRIGHRVICNCKGCEAKLIEIHDKSRKQKVEKLKEYWDCDMEPICIDDLTPIERLAIAAIIREFGEEDFPKIRPIGHFHSPFAPTSAYQNELLQMLIERGALVVNLEESWEKINVVNDKMANKTILEYDLLELSFKLNVFHNDVKTGDLVDYILSGDDIFSCPTEILSVWKEVARYECVLYLQHNIKAVLYMAYVPAKKTYSMIDQMLESFSSSQIYYFIYSSTTFALRFHVEKGANKIWAANSVMPNALNSSERAMLENWQVKNYNRPYACPQSGLSKYLFNRVLKIGDRGFYERPSIDSVM